MYVITNVDDFGLHPAVNRAVRQLGEQGIVTSSTILANGPYAKEFKEIDSISFGVHLNLLRGKPLTEPDKISSLLNSSGNLVGDYKSLFFKYLTGKLDLNQIRLEWENQVISLLDLGLKPTHLDSEKHIHAWPQLMKIAQDLADKYRIKWLRRPFERMTKVFPDAGWLRVFVLRMFSAFHRKHKSVGWPDLVWGIAGQGESLDAEKFGKYLKKHGKNKIIELVVHPGLPVEGDEDIDDSFGNLRVPYQWKAEYDSLLKNSWKEMLIKNSAILTHYGNLDPREFT